MWSYRASRKKSAFLKIAAQAFEAGEISLTFSEGFGLSEAHFLTKNFSCEKKEKKQRAFTVLLRKVHRSVMRLKKRNIQRFKEIMSKLLKILAALLSVLLTKFILYCI